MNKFDEDMLKIIFLIKKKPAILIDKSVTCLRSFLDGFTIGYSYPNTRSVFPDFQIYVEKYFHCDLSISWNQILLLHTKNEEKAFSLFFELFEDFLEENRIDYRAFL